jgi:hypothetical protein
MMMILDDPVLVALFPPPGWHDWLVLLLEQGSVVLAALCCGLAAGFIAGRRLNNKKHQAGS